MKFVYPFLLAGICMVGAAGASKVIQITFGPDWTRDRVGTSAATSWNAGLESGIIVDKKVGFGFEGDFLWNSSQTDSSTGGGNYQTIKEDKSFMFPLGGFILIDPFTDWIVHPTAKLNIGYNSLVRKTKNPDSEASYDYYYGLLVKAGADALYNFGEFTGVFLGADYQWAQLRTGGKTFQRRDLSGPGLHAGFRAAF
jgi:hypothetical protein